jgi:prepilin-type N-terminal cleavage/methylation domain-containing protein
MKKSRGFTLIELLIVTVVIVTLMAVVFRLAGTGGESTARAKTLARLQKLSNALSGYYAAFGSYPPVPLQGRSRDIYTRVDGSGSMGHGIQSKPDDRNTPSFEREEMTSRIEAACRAQPVAAGYPYEPPPDGPAEDLLLALHEEYHIPLYHVIKNDGGFNRDSSDWQENNVFMFGLLSFLLPRYQFMMNGVQNLYKYHRSWLLNNRMPYLLDGSRLGGWDEAQSALMMGPGRQDRSPNPAAKAMLEQLPSQAVCARWMPNFKGIVTSRPVPTVTEFFGVETEAPNDFGVAPEKWFVISQNGYGSESSYINGTKTVLDGWGEEFYYCSMPPYQSYQLWSSGPNKRTFPPWVEPPSGDRQLVNEWIADDIKVGDK